MSNTVLNPPAAAAAGDQPVAGESLPPEILVDRANQLRRTAVRICRDAASGHIGASTGAAELFTVLYFGGVLRYSGTDPRHPLRDRVLVRGHLGPLRYPLFAHLGWVDPSEFSGYRRLGSRLQGHEEHALLPGVDITPSGSLGMLLSYGTGSALAARDNGHSFHTWVFIGDGEEQEGNVSEAARHAATLRLPGLIAVLDRNGAQLSDPVGQVDSTNMEELWTAYGWQVVSLRDGHDVAQIKAAFRTAQDRSDSGPVIVIADTHKGHGLEGNRAHYSGYHTIGVTPSEVVDEFLTEDGETMVPTHRVVRPSDSPEPLRRSISITPSQETPAHLDQAQFEYFSELRARWDDRIHGHLYFMSGDTTPAPFVDKLQLRDFARYHNVGIREQHLAGMTHGLTLTDPRCTVILNTIDAFSYRYLDQLNSLVYGGGRALILGDVAGVTNGRNGASHQSSGQTAALLGIPGLSLLEPADVTDLFACLNRGLSENAGATYIRIHSSHVDHQSFVPATERSLRWYVSHDTAAPEVTVIASGMSVGIALDAARRSTVPTRVVTVIDQESIDPSIADVIPEGADVVFAYNGNPQPLRSRVCEALIAAGRGIRRMRSFGFVRGTSGTVEELLGHHRMTADDMSRALTELASQP
ncbi:thiamine pyrophosphate-dependent enzyme [Microlunatus soli]|uniref:Transketolase, pyrimidine binding domain n=1 Tax=Microlunatus soli TaxID=630515 RepID=A0A1H1SA07_9ACTN|nr:thiamine pyrophosphate-dependent enzyme [Microlunatus soli]SDS44596.1 Transketolase, pyrimidine binding domain [Microlunatus soli]